MTPFLAFFAAVGTSGGQSLDWPMEPPLMWQIEGMILAERGAPTSLPLPRFLKKTRPAGWNDVLEPEARHLSTWSTGGSHVRSEWAILLTPRSAARWLGFGRVREGWGESEIQARWNTLSTQLDGRVTLLFCRTAYPKRAALGVGSDSGPNLTRLEFPAPQIRTDGRLCQARLTKLISLQSRERRLVESADWWNSSPLAVRSQEFSLPPLGEYHRDWWMLQAILPRDQRADRITFALQSPERVQKAVWNL